MTDAIRKAPLFADLTPREVDEVRASIQLRHFADGEPLMAQGAASDGAYVITRGRVAGVFLSGSRGRMRLWPRFSPSRKCA